MRINRLDLTRYGKFTDRSIDFGRQTSGAPDLHILYGPNEAGKSTTLSAWLDLLFGIPTQSNYGFLHPYNTMRIGAALQIGDRQIEIARTKGRQNTLLDASGAALPETVLQPGLGGIDRAAYQAMFSLDDETLEAGGESILASQGDLGQLLFSASAGLADLSANLDAQRKEADAFHRSGARKGGLADLKAELADLDDHRRKIDTQASDYARLSDAQAQAQTAWQAAQTAQAEAATRLESVRRTLTALPLYTRLTGVINALAPLASLPVPPTDWAETLPDLARSETAISTRLEEIAAAIIRLEAQLLAANPDPAVLARGPRVAATVALKSAHDEAVKDLPARRSEAAEAAIAIAGLLHRLGHPNRAPEDLLLPAATIGGLRGLIEARSGVTTRLAAAQAEAEAARNRQTDAEAALGGAGGSASGIGAVTALVATLRARDPAQALRQAERQVTAAEAALAPRLASLRPWNGKGTDLLAMDVPSRDRLEALAQQLEECARAAAEADATLARLTHEATRHDAALNARQTAGRATAEDAVATRAARERLWAAHRDTLTEASAEAFEAALRRDDQITADRAALGAEEAASARAREALAVLRADIRAAEPVRDTTRARHSQLVTELAGVVTRVSPALPATMTALALRDWVALRALALEAQSALSQASADRDAARGTALEAREALSAALVASGVASDPSVPFDTLFAQAQSLSDIAARLSALRETMAEATRTNARRSEELARAEAMDRAWTDELAALCAGTWLADSGLPDVAGVREVLTVLDLLDRAVAQRSGLTDRIAKMEANQAAFGTACAELGKTLALPSAEPAQLWHEITDRLAKAEAARQTRDEATAELQAAFEKQAAQQAAAERLAARIAEMAGFFGVSSLAEVRDSLAASARKAELLAARGSLEQDIQAALGCDTLPKALALVSGADHGALDHDHARLSAEADQLARAAQEDFARLSEARRQLDSVGGDDAVARLAEARQTVLLDMAEATRHHLRQRFGVLAVDHALRTYRDNHRSGMMRRASDAFSTISRGAYTGLAAQPEKDREVLVALAADGGSKLAQNLSKGTRFQLYLALRVAGYHEYAQSHSPVPFIADDIMETFDDDRAAEAFTLLAGMAQVGQVIYLTHHRHLCDIAVAICPGATVHTLP